MGVTLNMMISTIGFVLAAVLTSSPATPARTAGEPPVPATFPSAAEVSVVAGEAAYLANIQTVAVRTSRTRADETAALTESLGAWLRGVDTVSSDDADVIIEWTEDTNDVDTGGFRWGDELNSSDFRWAESDDEIYARDFTLTGDAGELVTNDFTWAEDADEELDTSGWLRVTLREDGVTSEDLRPSDHAELPAGTEPSLRWKAVLFRIDCQPTSFAENSYRPANGRCEGEIPVFVRTHLAEIKGRAHDRDAAVAALAETLRELIVGVPRGINREQL